MTAITSHFHQLPVLLDRHGPKDQEGIREACWPDGGTTSTGSSGVVQRLYFKLSSKPEPKLKLILAAFPVSHGPELMTTG